MPVCCIVGAVPVEVNFDRKPDDLIIAADGGLDSLKKSGICPDVFLGDMDSVSNTDVPENVVIIRHPVEKDDTDSALAVRYAADLGYTEFVIYGCIGGALDHTLANVALLKNMAELGYKVVFIDGECAMTAITGGELCFEENAQGRISILSVSDISENVVIKGMKYSVSGVTLTSSVPLGVSNVFAGCAASVSAERGTLGIYTSVKNILQYSDLFDKYNM